MTLETVAVILLVLLLIGVFPGWPHAARWGYGPVGMVVVILLMMLLLRAI